MTTPKKAPAKPKAKAPARTRAPKAKAAAKKPRRTDKQRRQKVFLENAAKVGYTTEAARLAGVGRQQPYAWAKEDPEFAAAWEEAKEESADELERQLRRLAVEGTLAQRFDEDGNVVYEKREYSVAAAIFLLKGLRPDTYIERRQITGKGKRGALALELIDQVLNEDDGD